MTTARRCTGRGQLKARWASTRTLPPTPHICTGHLQQLTVALQRQQRQTVYRRTLIGGLSRRRRRPVRPALFLINTRRRLPCSCVSAIVVIRRTHMAMRVITHPYRGGALCAVWGKSIACFGQIAGVRPGWTVPYGSSHYNDNNGRSCTICLVWRSHIYLRPLRLHRGAPFLLAPPWASSIAASARSTPLGLLPSPLQRTLVSTTSS